MEVGVVFTVVVGIVGIVAGIVQVIQYIQERKEKGRETSFQNQEPLPSNNIVGANSTNEVVEIVETRQSEHQASIFPNMRKIEKELRMKKYHWIKAGFSIPSDNFSFTAVFFQNQLEVLKRLQTHMRSLIRDLKGKSINPSHPRFLEKAYEMLDEIDSRTDQIDDVLRYEESHPLSLSAQKANQNILINSKLFRKMLAESSVSGIFKPDQSSRSSHELILQLRTLEISGQELQKQLKIIYDFAESIVIVE